MQLSRKKKMELKNYLKFHVQYYAFATTDSHMHDNKILKDWIILNKGQNIVKAFH